MHTTIFLSLIVLSTSVYSQAAKSLEKVTWYGQSAIKIEHDGKNAYIDPYQMPDAEAADLVLITHSHQDHLSLSDIEKVADKDTPIICPASCEETLKEGGFENLTIVSPGSELSMEGFKIEAVPMYNIVKTKYHPIENEWTGFIIQAGDSRIYHAGDTERIPEMKNVDCDIVMLPLGQTYTMNSVEEAAAAALDTGAEIAVPIHYGLYEGTEADAIKFRDLLDGKMQVVILDRAK